ncbi:glycosyltransferase [Salinibacter altiplanensis]|uniref:glycosyltransferase n=1 Tax=Salinibacter altiplanensis TaxID=1803181 RepID=UPI000C9EFAFF|nr:glycosyltransferase [Salinibacter altiplanensis]
MVRSRTDRPAVMHVLVVPSWYPTTEVPLNGIYFAEQARCLQAHGMTVGVVYPEQQSLRRATVGALRRKHFQTAWTTDHGVPTLRRYGWNVWWRVPPGLRCRVRSAVRLARRYVDRRGVPDVIHAQSARWAGAAAARMSNALGVPYVLTEHFSGFQRGGVWAWRRPLVDRGLRRASGLAAVSAALKEALATRKDIASGDVAIHPNPVRASFFTRPPEGRPSRPPFRFVTIARLNSRKNIGGLIEALAQAFEGSNDVVLTVVGDGPQRAALEAQARRLNVADRVDFRGQQRRAGVRAALREAHAFVLPSRHETFGVVLVEAMATGLPVVATRCGGPEDIVTKETGMLVPPAAPTALAQALCTIRTRWGGYDAECIRAHAVDRYGPEPFVRRTQSFYRCARAA